MSLISVNEAAARLRAGNVVAIPTETVYGLAGRIDDESALKQIFHVKERPFFDPLIVHVAEVPQARRLAREWPEIFAVLTEAFWPGPLTLVTAKTEAISPLITSGLDSVALRCPRHPVALELLREVGIPLAAPSANRFGRTSPTRASHVEAEFEGKVAVVDGGPSEVGVESTVLSVEEGPVWKIHILRPGGVSRTEIHHILSQAGFQFEILRTPSPVAPGQLKAHYQPSCPVVIVNQEAWTDGLKESAELALNQKFTHVRALPLGSSPQIAARELYENFRDFSEIPGSLIVALRTQANSGSEWEAIWDRIERASSLQLN
ncbi:MAG TPA: L-threonylcarbamoyladenylate synthase [Bdellovibrionales bacterium]|nr:L-threonylcarbamoyladenylate synthase [Bdellovibrionales bacterium]